MIELTGIGWDHPRAMGPLVATAPLYAERTGVRVSWSARSLKDFGDAPIDALAERYDLIILDHPHLGVALTDHCPLVAMDRYLDAATLQTLADQSAGPSHASYTLGDHPWALAVDGAMQSSAFRPDLFKDELPSGWDAALTLAEDLADAPAKLAIPLAACDAVCSFISICAGQGAMDQPAVRFVERERGLDALGILRRLKAAAHPASVHWNPIQMLDHMSTHNDVAYCPLTFCYTNYSRTGFRDKPVRFGAIPQRTGSILGGAGFAVSAKCRYPAEACAYGAWLCSAGVQAGPYTEHGGQPGNRVAWTDPLADAITGGFFSGTLDVIDHAFVRPRHLGWPAFQEWAGNTIRDMLIHDTSPSDCLDALEARYTQSLSATLPN